MNIRFSVIFLFVLTSCFLAFFELEARLFVRRGPGIGVDAEARVWNLSNTVELDAVERRNAPRYHALPVTDGPRRYVCLSEIVEGRRMRYILDSLSACWQGEETVRMIVCPPEPIESMAFSETSAGHPDGVSYHSSGHYGQDVTVSQDGVYSSWVIGEGLVVLGTDTIHGRMTSERREYTMELSAVKDKACVDTAVQAPVRRYVWQRHRWFVDGERLPVAVQTDAAVLDGAHGNMLRERSVLYTVDASELAMEKTDNQNEETESNGFDDIEVDWNGDRIVIRPGSGVSGEALIGITTPDGLPCLTRTERLKAVQPIEIEVPDLYPDRKYIFYITVSGITYKRLISRR